MFVFLQNWRATLIPAIAVPVVLLGTFGVLAAFGYSINTLTLFALVLAIGLLVDDAIVVVENVERVMREERLSPREATAQVDGRDHRRADRDRARAVGGVPADGVLRRLDRRHLPAVLGHDRLGDGAVGHRRAGADAGAVRHAAASRCPKARSDAHGWFFTRFNRDVRAPAANATSAAWRDCSDRASRRCSRTPVIVALLALLFVRLPTGFLPRGGSGRPVHADHAAGRRDPAAHARRREAGRAVSSWSTRRRTSTSVFIVAGFSFAGRARTPAMAFVNLRAWDERPGKAQQRGRDRRPRDAERSRRSATRRSSR